ncbi:MAG: aminomethyltransferase, partial [Acidobacteriota bacterium]|nr:aminomethyltransferase [Acidobacteriota bacterium]
GIPVYGKDMDETTVVPEIGIEGLIHYQKGCYIGQEVIARIHFLGKPSKLLKGLEFEGIVVLDSNDLLNEEGKNAGRITSRVYSPSIAKTIALGYVRNAFVAEGTVLKSGDKPCTVVELPFID